MIVVGEVPADEPTGEPGEPGEPAVGAGVDDEGGTAHPTAKSGTEHSANKKLAEERANIVLDNKEWG